MLNDFGVDFIELGHPVVSKDIYRTNKLLNSEPLTSPILRDTYSANLIFLIQLLTTYESR